MLSALVLLISLSHQAAFSADIAKVQKNRKAASMEIPTAVENLAEKLKSEVRTKITAYYVPADKAVGCYDEGMYYNIKVQIKKLTDGLDEKKNPMVKEYWETVRDINADDSGNSKEVCLE